MKQATLMALTLAGIATKLSALYSELASNFASHMLEMGTAPMYSSSWIKWVTSAGANIIDPLMNL
ncbi:hypothetical protein ABT344_29820 [Micromonospora carbonacea]|uniref:hypothetical protein n=1 Tax=Micromonospora carbonacea TaxID=47853 RepID=UPI0033208F0E